MIGSDSRVFRYFLLYTYSTCVYIERESAAARAATLFTCRIFYFYLATNGGKLGDCRLVFAPVALLWLKRRDQSVFESPTRRDAVCQSAAGREKVGTRGIKSQLNMFLGTRCDCWLCFFSCFSPWRRLLNIHSYSYSLHKKYVSPVRRRTLHPLGTVFSLKD